MRARDFINLSELKMSPGSLKNTTGNISGLTIGIEYELVVPRDPGYLNNKFLNLELTSVDDIVTFFSLYGANTETDIDVGLRNLLNKAEAYVVGDNEILDHALTVFPDIKDVDQLAERFVESEYFNLQEFLEYNGLSNPFEIAAEMHLVMPDPMYSQVATSISKLLGKKTHASMKHNDPNKSYEVYNIEPDPSIHPGDKGVGVEVVSPPLPLEAALADFKKLTSWFHKIGAFTNDSTGLHINISVPGYDLNTIDYIKLALFSGDSHVLSQFDRVINAYAVSSMSQIRSAAQRQMDFDASEIFTKMKSSLRAAARSIYTQNSDKYVSINLKPTHVEFRAAGNDWLGTYFGSIEPTILRYSAALNVAIDTEAEKQEYAKKLYKLVSGYYSPDYTDVVAKFTQYAANLISKEDLKGYLVAKNKFREVNKIIQK